MKSIYVLNLDPKRITLIVICIIAIIFITFITGRKSLEQDLNKLLSDTIITNGSNIDNIRVSEKDIHVENARITHKQPDSIIKKTAIKSQPIKIKSRKIIHPAPVQEAQMTSPKKNIPTHRNKENNKLIANIPKRTNSHTQNFNKNPNLHNTSQKVYTIQLGAFKRESDAKRYVQELKKKNIHAMVVRGIVYYLVCIGSSKNKKSLKTQQQQINTKVKDKSFIAYRKIN